RPVDRYAQLIAIASGAGSRLDRTVLTSMAHRERGHTPMASLDEALNAFAARQPGPEAFEALADAALDLIRTDPEDAAAAMAVGFTVRLTLERFSDRPLTMDDANAAKERLLTAAREVAASRGASAEQRLQAINQLV